MVVSEEPAAAGVSPLGSVLVTGGAGFIGIHLVRRLLSEGQAVRILIRRSNRPTDSSAVQRVFGDVRDPESVRLALDGVETVFHLAARAHEVKERRDTGQHHDVTVNGTRTLLAAAVKSGVKRFIYFSSLSVYGITGRTPVDELLAPAPTTPYGRAKLEAERLVLEAGRANGFHVSCLRPAMVYGPGCKGNLLRMIRMIDLGLFPPVPEFDNRKSMVHVSSLVDAALLAARRPAANGQCYLVTDEQAYSTREIYEMIAAALGRAVPGWRMPAAWLLLAARTGDLLGRVAGRRFFFDSLTLEKLAGSAHFSSDKIRRELGFRPSCGFAESLLEVIAAYRSASMVRD